MTQVPAPQSPEPTRAERIAQANTDLANAQNAHMVTTAALEAAKAQCSDDCAVVVPHPITGRPIETVHGDHRAEQEQAYAAFHATSKAVVDAELAVLVANGVPIPIPPPATTPTVTGPASATAAGQAGTGAASSG